MAGLKRTALGLLSAFLLLSGMRAFAADDVVNESEFEDKASQAHKLASSDMIYQNEEWKAIYYQNQQIIQLLKQVRDSLNVIKSNDNLKKTEEK